MASIATYRGRPLYFMALVMLLWITCRLLAAWALLHPHEASAMPTAWHPRTMRKTPAKSLAPPASTANDRVYIHAITVSDRSTPPLSPNEQRAAHFQSISPSGWTAPLPATLTIAPNATSRPASTAPENVAPSHFREASTPPDASPDLPSMHGPGQDRWMGSAWLLWRHNSAGSSLATQGRLGGSQAGVRIDHDIKTTGIGTFQGYSRLSAALERPHSGEAALGISLRPHFPLPVSLGIERRIRLSEGGRNAFALVTTAGIGPRDIGSSLSVEGYAQAGFVGFRSTDGFVDGRLSLTHSLIKQRVSAGLAVSGGAQPGLSRLDIGPVAEIRLPMRSFTPRLLVEWRERITGRAAPDSGLTITLASNF